MSNEDLDFVKTRTKQVALFSYRNYNNNVPQNLSKEEKSDEGNSVVVVDKADYLDKMENLLNDTGIFEKKKNLKNDEILNFAINQEKTC